MANVQDLIAGFKNVGQQQAQPNGQPNGQKKPPAKYWINVGVQVGDVFVQLPVGIPLDGVQARKIPSAQTKNPEFRELRITEAQLWAKIQQLMQSMKPGDEHEIPTFSCKIRMCQDQENAVEEPTSLALPDSLI